MQLSNNYTNLAFNGKFPNAKRVTQISHKISDTTRPKMSEAIKKYEGNWFVKFMCKHFPNSKITNTMKYRFKNIPLEHM